MHTLHLRPRSTKVTPGVPNCRGGLVTIVQLKHIRLKMANPATRWGVSVWRLQVMISVKCGERCVICEKLQVWGIGKSCRST
jgi:hypothetical protein